MIQYNLMPNSRMEKEHIGREGISCAWQSLKGWITNISFKMEEISVYPLTHKTPLIDSKTQNNQAFFVSGTKIDNFDNFMQAINETLWFTYRKNAKMGMQTYSDIGWGCLLRVAQMAFANTLLNHSKNKSEIDRLSIINACTQRREAEYGIVSFIQAGYELWNRKVGDWYSMTQVAMVVQTLQERRPLKGTQNVKIAVYNQVASIDQLLQYFGRGLGKGSISTNYKLSNNQQIPLDKQGASGSKQENEDKREIFLMITTQFHDQSRQKNQQQLLRLMELSIFSSCMGAVPQKARFIIGKLGDKLCYIDPHYVQQAVQTTTLTQDQLNTFTCTNPRWMKCDELESNLTVCFHLKDQQDVKMLMSAIDATEDGGINETFVSYTWSCKPEGNIIYRSQQIEPQFQLLGSEQFEVMS